MRGDGKCDWVRKRDMEVVLDSRKVGEVFYWGDLLGICEWLDGLNVDLGLYGETVFLFCGCCLF